VRIGGGRRGSRAPLTPAHCSSQAARRDQNRIAQREFRQRKQQRVRVVLRAGQARARLTRCQIRDLEARVELLSGNKDEVVYEMRMMLKGACAFPRSVPA
jgi:hypothetical protein